MLGQPRKDVGIHNLDKRGSKTMFWSRRPTKVRRGVGKGLTTTPMETSLVGMTSLCRWSRHPFFEQK